MVFESFGIQFFFIRFVTHISISLMIFVLNYAFANILVCELWINCKIIHNKQDSKLYIIKKIFDFGFRTTISSLLYQKDFINVFVRPTDWATKPFKISLWYKLFCYHYTVNMHQTPFSLILCNGKIHLTVSLSQDIVNEHYEWMCIVINDITRRVPFKCFEQCI